MNIFHQRFSAGQVVEATDVSNVTLQSWLKRDLIVGSSDNAIEGGGSKGSHRRFSFHTIMQIAVAKALIDMGLYSAGAFRAAMAFAHAGGVGNAVEPRRDPGLPFDTSKQAGITVLCVAGDRSTELLWTPGTDPLPSIRSRLGTPAGFMLVEIDPIFRQVTQRLGHDYRTVLDASYGTAATEFHWGEEALAAFVAKHQ